MVQISARDSEFAVSTGDNVNVTPRTSNFDTPPNTYENLVITSNPEDASPYLFETGETYSLSFSGAAGPVTLENATVLRSDLLGNAETGAVVFEGTDPQLGTVQLIWTPNFNVEQWSLNTSNAGFTARFFTFDTQSATYGHVCFVDGTRILTATGLRAVEDLEAGELVQTRDNGLQPVRWVFRRKVLGIGSAAPVHFAPGVIGNTAPLRVSQQHRILVTGARAELLFGEPEVLVPARSLVNGANIHIAPQRRVEFLHILMDRHEILVAEGCAAESLLLGDVARGALAQTPGALPPDTPVNEQDMPAARMLLSVREGSLLARVSDRPAWSGRSLHAVA